MKASCIIPAYNEEKTISNIIKVVKEVELISEIIVVSDGSTDNTLEIARSLGIKTIQFKKNRGKGAALKAGIDKAKEEIVLFIDADLIGLNKYHIENLLRPLITEKADMTIGVFKNGRLLTDIAQKITPELSGQRAVKKSVLSYVGDIDITGYEVEIALTKILRKNNCRIDIVELIDMTHIMKEEKHGFLKGLVERIKMYWQIIKWLKM